MRAPSARGRSESGALLRRLSGFTALPLISAVSPLLLLPLIARVSTQEEWTVIAVGQSVGAFCGTLVYFGWNIVGPARITLAESLRERAEIYASSYWSRVVVLVSTAVAGCGTTAVLTGGEHVLLGAAMLLSTLTAGLSGAWFAIGVGSPKLVAVYEVLPRLIGIAVSVGAVLVVHDAIVYPAILLGATVVGLILFNCRVIGRAVPTWPGWRSTVRSVRNNILPTLVTAFGSVYTSAPVPLTTALNGAVGAAPVASADKLYRYSLFIVSALANGLQSWVVGSSRGRFGRRFRAALLAHAVLGLTGAAGLFFVGDAATRLLFGEHLRSGVGPSGGFALAFLATCVSTPFVRYVLIPLDRSGSVLAANAFGLTAGAASLAFTVPLAGAAGVPLSLGITESFTMILAVCLAVRAASRADRVDPSAVTESVTAGIEQAVLGATHLRPGDGA